MANMLLFSMQILGTAMLLLRRLYLISRRPARLMLTEPRSYYASGDPGTLESHYRSQRVIPSLLCPLGAGVLAPMSQLHLRWAGCALSERKKLGLVLRDISRLVDMTRNDQKQWQKGHVLHDDSPTLSTTVPNSRDTLGIAIFFAFKSRP
jgi:hypothetical protein